MLDRCVLHRGQQVFGLLQLQTRRVRRQRLPRRVNASNTTVWVSSSACRSAVATVFTGEPLTTPLSSTHSSSSCGVTVSRSRASQPMARYRGTESVGTGAQVHLPDLAVGVDRHRGCGQRHRSPPDPLPSRPATCVGGIRYRRDRWTRPVAGLSGQRPPSRVAGRGLTRDIAVPGPGSAVSAAPETDNREPSSAARVGGEPRMRQQLPPGGRAPTGRVDGPSGWTVSPPVGRPTRRRPLPGNPGPSPDTHDLCGARIPTTGGHGRRRSPDPGARRPDRHRRGAPEDRGRGHRPVRVLRGPDTGGFGTIKRSA